MSVNGGNMEMKKNSDGKNKNKVFCQFCPSKILNSEAAKFVNIEYSLPHIHQRGEGEESQEELITDFWLVEDMYTFENIGVSHTVGDVKYLACADCERGPVGWYDLTTKKSYIALCRVEHK